MSGIVTNLTSAQQICMPTITRTLYNRTGAALAKGDLVSVDLTGSATEVETYTAWESSDGELAHPFANVISVATAHLKGWVFAVAAETIADNASGMFYLQGIVDVEFPDASTDDIDAGDQITATNAATYASLGNDAQAVIGIALEDAVSAVATKKCIFWGGTQALSGTGSADLS